MENLQNRHDLTDEQWNKIEPIIKDKLGTWGGRWLNTKIHLAVDANGMPIRFIITKGTTHDSQKLSDL